MKGTLKINEKQLALRFLAGLKDVRTLHVWSICSYKVHDLAVA